MQKIGAIPMSPNRYQQLTTIAFAICESIRYGIIDYPAQRQPFLRKAKYVLFPKHSKHKRSFSQFFFRRKASKFEQRFTGRKLAQLP
jgi:hypothetical protein